MKEIAYTDFTVLIFHLNIQAFGGGKELTTQLYFKNDVPPSFEDYVSSRGSQFPQKVQATSRGRTITFDIVMDV